MSCNIVFLLSDNQWNGMTQSCPISLTRLKKSTREYKKKNQNKIGKDCYMWHIRKLHLDYRFFKKSLSFYTTVSLFQLFKMLNILGENKSL
ncbi:hypothetical protein BpHYR1_013872 [Brachionus plicatilis]|uniref:Uncharacterized protein n=1 Tax=Brachionus plicatilis TaxID=10195 RepID=A0A3M7SAJ1_BRAPC|nr:hypothetical protein BpHYR1_013872 [Brachionus plicatilis]